MNIYLVRHADAVPVGEAGVTTDEERPLSTRGNEQVAILADALMRHGIVIDRIVSSPLRRAVQTAEELRRHLSLQPEVLLCEQLAPGQSSKRLAKYLQKLEGNHVVLVGHEPDLSQHTAWLIGSKKAALEFAKSGIANVACDGNPAKGTGTLVWLVTPEWLKR